MVERESSLARDKQQQCNTSAYQQPSIFRWIQQEVHQQQQDTMKTNEQTKTPRKTTRVGSGGGGGGALMHYCPWCMDGFCSKTRMRDHVRVCGLMNGESRRQRNARHDDLEDTVGVLTPVQLTGVVRHLLREVETLKAQVRNTNSVLHRNAKNTEWRRQCMPAAAMEFGQWMDTAIKARIASSPDIYLQIALEESPVDAVLRLLNDACKDCHPSCPPVMMFSLKGGIFVYRRSPTTTAAAAAAAAEWQPFSDEEYRTKFVEVLERQLLKVFNQWCISNAERIRRDAVVAERHLRLTKKLYSDKMSEQLVVRVRKWISSIASASAPTTATEQVELIAPAAF